MLFDPQSHEAVVFKNNAAVLMWLFMAVWMGMLVYFTNLAVLAPGFPAFVVALLALFWVMGLGFTALALWAPLVRVEISQDGVFVRQRAPLWRCDRRFEPKDLSISSTWRTRTTRAEVFTTPVRCCSRAKKASSWCKAMRA